MQRIRHANKTGSFGSQFATTVGYKNTMILFLFIFFTVASSSATPPSDFTLFGTAVVNNKSSITLTQQHLNGSKSDPPHSNLGIAMYKHPIQFLDSTSNSTLSFYTSFTFSIEPPRPPFLSGDGLAFFITTDSISLPQSVGSTGLPKSDPPNSSFLAIEFDINDNHLSINLGSKSSFASYDLNLDGINLKSKKYITAWIEYRQSQKTVLVYVGYSQKRTADNLLLVAPIDLSERFNKSIYVGLSASNGNGSAIHTIHSWYFRTTDTFNHPFRTDDCLICFLDPNKEEERTALQDFLDILELLVVVNIRLLARIFILYLLGFFNPPPPLPLLHPSRPRTLIGFLFPVPGR